MRPLRVEDRTGRGDQVMLGDLSDHLAKEADFAANAFGWNVGFALPAIGMMLGLVRPDAGSAPGACGGVAATMRA